MGKRGTKAGASAGGARKAARRGVKKPAATAGAWEEAAKKPAVDAAAPMTAEELLAEGRRLARPAWWLVPGTGPVVATWGGEETWLGAARGSARPLLTVDLASFPGVAQGLVVPGTCARVVRLEQMDDDEVRVRVDARGELPRDGMPLVRREVESLPPLEQVFRLGSARVGAWLARLAWGRGDGMNSDFPAPAVTGPYEREYRASCALCSSEAEAVVGGWPATFPDGRGPPGASFVLMTVRDAEPWYEVWWKRGRLTVLGRVT